MKRERVLLLAITTSLSPAAVMTAQAQQESQAVVTATSAEFVIPVGHEGPWRWARTTTADNAGEYRWEIGLKSGGEYYRFGFSRFKRPGSDEETGSLDELVKSGQASLWKVDPLDGHGSVVPGARVSVAPGGQHVVVRILDAALVTRLFADRPATVKVLTKTPDSAAGSYEVSVSYRD